MNITIVCDVLGRVNNGTVLATKNLINHLESKGHTVTVVSPDTDTEGKENYYIVPALNLGKFLNGIVEKNGVTLAHVDEKILAESMQNADIVHVQVPLLLGCAAVKIAKKLGKPITASFHCQAENISAHIGLMNFKPFNHMVYKKFYRDVYQYCDRVHYPTQFIRDLFERETGKATNAVVISNGVSEEFFAPAEEKIDFGKFTIVCCGRYSKEKAQWQLIKAIAKSRHKDEIKVIFAGDGPYKDSLSNLGQELGVDCEFNFYSRPELIKVLHSADLYVHTALVEIEAIACMEAIVCGLVPIICNSERSATKYFALDEKCLFEPEDIDGLTEKIDFWMDNEELKKTYAEKYKHVSRDFSLGQCMQKMEDMLISVAEEKRKVEA